MVIAIWTIFAGCGSDDNNNNILPRNAYPEGPYGIEEGEIMDSLTFLDPSNDETGTLSFEDLFLNPDNQLILLTTSAGWCTACIEEQPVLTELFETYGPDGLVVMVILFEDGDFIPAYTEFAAQWKTQYELDFYVVADPDFQMGDYYDRSLTPHIMLIDINQMEIVKTSSGFDRSLYEALIQAIL
jgi:thiol-disulfide isomerase/thioredoxin